MPVSTRDSLVSLRLMGGWSSDAGPSATSVTDGSQGIIQVPWLVDAENVVYMLDGWFRKMPGAARTNTDLIGSASDQVRAMIDYWRSTTSGNPVQRIVVSAGTQIWSSSDFGASYTSLTTGLENNTPASFTVFRDTLIWASTSTVDVPQSWNGIAASTSNLGGSPPNFAFCAEYKDRLWASGVDSAKSRVYYTVLGSASDWTGSGSGSIDIAPDDVDTVTGLRNWKDRLTIFKGPNRGSIHYITGSAPTGSDSFALHPFIRKVGAVNNQSIIEYADDLYFIDNNGAHSLKATANYGDYFEQYMSRDIADYWIRNLNHAQLAQAAGLAIPPLGLLLWAVPRGTVATNNQTLALDLRFQPARWSMMPGLGGLASFALVKESGVQVPWAGAYNGRTYRLNRDARNVENAAYTAKVTFPYVGFSDPFIEKALGPVRVSYAPKGDYNFTLGVTRDGAAQQTALISQGGGATLG